MTAIIRIMFVICALTGVSGLAHGRVIDKPDYECRKSGVLEIERITLSPDETRVDFLLTAPVGYKGKVGKNSRLCDVATGESYMPLRGEGVTLDKSIKVPAEGSVRYSLLYPPLPSDVKAVDFIEGSWDIFGIRLDGRKARKAPRALRKPELLRQTSHPDIPVPLFKSGKVRISGVVDGYDPRAFGDVLQMAVPNRYTGDMDMSAINVKSDGTFAADLEISSPGVASIYSLKSQQADVYLEPDGNLYLFFDFPQWQANQCIGSDSIPDILFGGSLGAINAGLYGAPEAPVIRVDKLAASDKSLLTGKAEIDTVCAKWGAAIEDYISAPPGLHPISVNLLRNSVFVKRAYTLLDYEMRKNRLGMSRITSFNPDSTLVAFYADFIPELLKADTVVVATSMYLGPILNRLAFSDIPSLMIDENAELEKLTYPVGSAQAGALRSVRDRIDVRNRAMMEFAGLDTMPYLLQLTAMQSFCVSYRGDAQGTRREAMCVLDSVRSVTHPRLREVLADVYYKKYETAPYALPDTDGGRIMGRILEPYKGKAVIVDFWSTGCGPCRAEIEHWKEFRDTHRDRDYMFLFITNDSESGKEAYDKYVAENMTNDISIRIPESDYMHLRQLFNFNGIPRYILVDPSGMIVDHDYRLTDHRLKSSLDKMGITL